MSPPQRGQTRSSNLCPEGRAPWTLRPGREGRRALPQEGRPRPPILPAPTPSSAGAGEGGRGRSRLQLRQRGGAEHPPRPARDPAPPPRSAGDPPARPTPPPAPPGPQGPPSGGGGGLPCPALPPPPCLPPSRARPLRRPRQARAGGRADSPGPAAAAAAPGYMSPCAARRGAAPHSVRVSGAEPSRAGSREPGGSAGPRRGRSRLVTWRPRRGRGRRGEEPPGHVEPRPAPPAGNGPSVRRAGGGWEPRGGRARGPALSLAGGAGRGAAPPGWSSLPWSRTRGTSLLAARPLPPPLPVSAASGRAGSGEQPAPPPPGGVLGLPLLLNPLAGAAGSACPGLRPRCAHGHGPSASPRAHPALRGRGRGRGAARGVSAVRAET